jgi:chromosomal replication initiator protein
MNYKEQEYQVKVARYERLKNLRLRITNEMIRLNEEMNMIVDPTQYAIWIQKTVAEHFGIPMELLLNGKHDRDLVDPRHMAISLVRQNTCLSTTRIAKLFNKDHSTVIHACHKVDNLCSVDKDYRMSFERIKMQIEC